jgi:ABC-type phosphate transport system substrate-binding protein
MKARMTMGLALAACLACAAVSAQVVVVTSSKSPVAKLDKGQVVDLYLGASKDVPGVGTVALFALAPPVRDEFYSKVLGKDAAQVKATWSRLIFSGKGIAPKEMGSAGDLKAALAANPNALGYLDKGDVDGSVKVVFGP